MALLVDNCELKDLIARYGEPLRWARSLEVGRGLFEKRRRALVTKRGEIVLVVPRPRKNVLLHTKAFYPPGAFRLLSGGIKKGERVEDAIGRELAEETGFEAKPVRLLGVVEYEFVSASDHVFWVSYVIQTRATRAKPHPADVDEEISEFRQVPLFELDIVAEKLEDLEGDWNDWGRFRAISHRLAYQALA